MRAKGQSSMEFVSTYGWAIVIILIVLVAAWQMKLFDIGGKLAPGSSGFSVLVPLEWSLTGSGSDCSLSVVMANGAGQGINSVKTLGGEDCVPSTALPGDNTVCWKSIPACTGPGSSFEAELVVTYKRSSDNQSFRTSGTLWGSSE